MRKPLLSLAVVTLATAAAEVALQASASLPPTDEVHGFLDLLEQLTRIER
jgi:hypothetical protein